MRVVSGASRGLKLVAPEGLAVRPTTDRVREAMFNALGSMGAVSGASVVDLFAGSGALGIEAVSRGARRCTFCESDPRALGALRTNLAHTRTEDRAQVVVGDTMALLSDGGPLAAFSVDLALADPPYGFRSWPELLGLLDAEIVVAESDRAVDPVPGWRVLRQRAYGSTVVTILERSSGSDPDADPREETNP